MNMVQADNLSFEYIRRNEEGEVESISKAIDGVSMTISKGDFVAILGHNGSGKSTLAKHINALLSPTEGTLIVDGMDTSDEGNVWKIRQKAGMVFQNPDNQIIASVVEEDVAFGPENIGIPTEKILKRVTESLEAVGMTGRQQRHRLMKEGFTYFKWTTVVSLVISSVMSVTIIRFLAEELGMFVWRFTLMPVVLSLPLIMVLIIIIPVIAYNRLSRRSVIDRLRVE